MKNKIADFIKQLKPGEHKNDIDKLPNFLAVMSLLPALLSIVAYELVEYIVNVIMQNNPDYNSLAGLGMLFPMAIMMELATALISTRMYRRVMQIVRGIAQVAAGNYEVELEAEHLRPLNEVADNFNKMTRELRSMETLRKDFINDFSHEFKTPITSINGFARLLLDTEVPPEQQREYLQIIADESERLAELSRETLLMTKLDNQQNVPDKESYALDQQIKQSIILLSREWMEKKIEISADLEPILYYGNEELMVHIWNNLLNNAIKFTPEGGRIQVSLRKIGSKLQVVVDDSGMGMTEEQLSRVFNKFYQADPSHATKGMGLGLSIAYRVARLAGGEIKAASTPGEGSAFTVILPEEEP